MIHALIISLYKYISTLNNDIKIIKSSQCVCNSFCMELQPFTNTFLTSFTNINTVSKLVAIHIICSNKRQTDKTNRQDKQTRHKDKTNRQDKQTWQTDKTKRQEQQIRKNRQDKHTRETDKTNRQEKQTSPTCKTNRQDKQTQ